MAAQEEAGGTIPVRFVASLHQRNPVAGIVRADSDIKRPEDLSGRRVAGHSLTWFVTEYEAAMDHLGLGRPEVVGGAEGSYGAATLVRGEVDVIPAWADVVTVVQAKTGFPMRSVPLDVDVYSTGLIAADRVPLELAKRVRDAMRAGFELQRADPELGFGAFIARFPSMTIDDIRLNWSHFEELASGRDPHGAMEAATWERTIAYTAKTHAVPPMAPEALYRPEMATALATA